MSHECTNVSLICTEIYRAFVAKIINTTRPATFRFPGTLALAACAVRRSSRSIKDCCCLQQLDKEVE